jgi:hypothetical protein
MCGACAVIKIIRNNLDLRHIHVIIPSLFSMMNLHLLNRKFQFLHICKQKEPLRTPVRRRRKHNICVKQLTVQRKGSARAPQPLDKIPFLLLRQPQVSSLCSQAPQWRYLFSEILVPFSLKRNRVLFFLILFYSSLSCPSCFTLSSSLCLLRRFLQFSYIREKNVELHSKHHFMCIYIYIYISKSNPTTGLVAFGVLVG